MESSSTTARAYNDQPQKRHWPQADRPTVNTVLSNNAPSSSMTAPSPHPSSSAVSTPSSSYPSSPWSQSIGSSQPLPYTYFADGAHASSHPSQSPHPNTQLNSSAEWNTLMLKMSNPLDPAMFAALEANGAIGPSLAKQPFSQQLNSNQYIGHPISSNAVANIPPPTGVGVSLRDSWTNTSTPPFSPNFIPGAGVQLGDLIETLWPPVNKIADSTRGMASSPRQEFMDDIMNDSNWTKLTRHGKPRSLQVI